MPDGALRRQKAAPRVRRPSNDAALQPARLRGWELALAAMRLHHRPPDFVTLSGEEWDFKNWARAGRQPNSSLAWREVGEVIRMQVEAIRSHWPRAVVMVRTMYAAAYGGLGPVLDLSTTLP